MVERYVRMNILADGAKAKATLDDLTMRARKLETESPDLKITADDTKASKTIKDLQLKIQILNRERAEVAFETKGDEAVKAKLLDISFKLKRLSETTADADVGLKNAEKTEAQLIKIKLLLDSIHNKKVEVDIAAKKDSSSGLFNLTQRLAGAFKIPSDKGGSGGGSGGSPLSGLFSGGPGQALASGGPGLIGLVGSYLASLLPAAAGLGVGGLVGAGLIGGGIYGATSGTKALKVDTANIKTLQTAVKAGQPGAKPQLAAANQQFNKDSAFYQPFLAFQKSIKDLGQNLLAPLRSVMTPLMGVLMQFGKWLKEMGPQLSAMFKASLPFIQMFMNVMEQGGKQLIPAFTLAMNTMVKSGALKTMTQALVLLITSGLVPFLKILGPGMAASAVVFKASIIVINGILIGLAALSTWIARELVLMGHAFTDVGKVFYSIGRIIGALLTGNWTAMGHAVAALGNNFRNFFATLLTMLGGGFLKISAFGHMVASVFDTIRHDAGSIWADTWSHIFNVYNGVARNIEHAFDNFKHAIMAAWNETTHFLSAVWRQFWEATAGKAIARGFALIRNVIDPLRHFLSQAFDWIRHQVSVIWDNTWQNTVGRAIRAYRDITNLTTGFRHTIANLFDLLRHGLALTWDALWAGIKDKTRAGIQVLGTILNGLKNAFLSPINWVVHHALDPLVNTWDRIVGAVGQKNLQFHLPNFADGGRVLVGSGPRSDDVLARVSKGETVVSAQHSAALAPIFGAVGVPGYAAGGIPNPLSAVGGFLKNIGKDVLSWVGKGAGFITSHAFGGIESLLGHVPGATGVAHLVGDMGKSLIADAVKGVINALTSFGASQGGGLGGVQGAFTHSAAVAQAYARSLLSMYHWSQSQMSSLIPLWNQESGWSAYAVNQSSGAYGIPQSLGHGHPYALGDYKNQIIWGLNYIRGRYGSPAAAEAHERAFNWYGKGGWINEPIVGRGLRSGQGYAFGELGPEYVSPAGKGGGGGGVTYQINVTAGPLAHPADVGREVVRVIRKYEQRSGKGWRS